MNSKLLLAWAPRITSMALDDGIFKVSGIRAFLGHAKNIVSMYAETTCCPGSARFDDLLGCVSTITQLECEELYFPCVFPASLKELSICLGSLSMYKNDMPGASRLLELLVLRLRAWGGRLQRLKLDIQLPHHPASLHIDLECHAPLPPLDELEVSLTSPEVPEDLSWLQRQPCTRLFLEVDIMAENVTKQTLEVAALQQLEVQAFQLDLQCEFSEALQRVWQQLRALQLMSVVISGPCSQLHAVPRGREVRITIHGDRQQEVQSILINWAALASSPASYLLDVDSDYTSVHLQLCDVPDHLPFEGLGLPWQLEIVGTAVLEGFPASQKSCKAAFLLQNAAAVSAGWTEGMISRQFAHLHGCA